MKSYNKTKICPRCGQELPIEEFPWRTVKKKYRKSYCSRCHKEYHDEHNKEYRKEHKEETRNQWKKWYRNNREKQLERYREYYQKNKERLREQQRNHWKELRLRAMAVLSDNNIICRNCDIDDIRVLVIDHINNDGKMERRKNRTTMFNKIIELGSEAKERYQVLCHNCNWLKELGQRKVKYI